MTGILEVRRTIHDLIDNIPDHKLQALHPLLNILVEEAGDDTLSSEEDKLLEKCRMERKTHPENLTPWEKVRIPHPGGG